MYEKKFKRNEVVRQLRIHQGKRNDSERRALSDVIKEHIPYKPYLIELNELTVRTDCERGIFRAKYLRMSTHFPYIVPELVNDSGECLLMTYLTFGSLLRLASEVRQGKVIKSFDLFLS